MRVTIETERLIIRAVEVADAEAVFAWASDSDVTKYLLYSTHQNIEATKEWLSSRNLDDPESYDLGIVLKETGELIGMGGISKVNDEGLWNLGYNLRKDCWGNGYVPEAMKAIIDYVRGVTDVRAIEATYAKENTKSRRVMEKLGMSYKCDTVYTKFDKSATYEGEIYRIEYQ